MGTIGMAPPVSRKICVQQGPIGMVHSVSVKVVIVLQGFIGMDPPAALSNAVNALQVRSGMGLAV